MGRVYLARDRVLDVEVAVKVLPAEVATDEESLTQIQHEARAAARLRSSPGILVLYGFEQHGEDWFLVMEYAAGGSLHARLRQENRLSEQECRRLGAEVADALAFAHGLRIIHRDIKPANILLDAAGRAKVTDFGIAKIFAETSARQSQATVAGTPVYMAPEILLRQRVDGRADLYSLGCMLFEMATGDRPFAGSYFEIALAKTSAQAKPPDPRDLRPELTAEFATVVIRLLAPKPEDRYPDAGTCAAALREGLVEGGGLPRASRQDALGPGGLPPSITPRLPASLLIFAEPLGTRVAVDEVDCGPALEDGLEVPRLDPVVAHVVHGWFPDHDPAEAGPFFLEPGERREVRLRLERSAGWLRITSGAPGSSGEARRPGAPPESFSLDGEGGLPPVRFEVGEWVVVLRARGFETWQGRVQIKSGETATLPVSMAEVGGTLSLDTRPSGALVFEGETRLGEAPLMAAPLPPGRHDIRFEHPDTERLTRTVEVRGERDTDMGVVELPRLATVDLSALPEGVTCDVEGAEVRGKFRRRQGEVVLVLSRPKHRSQTLRLALRPGEVLVPLIGPWMPNPGRIVLTSLPPDVQILVDGRPPAPGARYIEVAPGRHAMEMRRPGFLQPAPLAMEVSPEEAIPAPTCDWVQLASLAVRTDPPEAQVQVDGEGRGKGGSEGVLVEDLDPTVVHEVRATLVGHEDAVLPEVRLQPGERREEDLVLNPHRGGVRVRGAPPSAVLRLWKGAPAPHRGDVKIGEDGCAEIGALPVGKYEVELECPGFLSRTVSLEVQKEETATIEAELREKEGFLSARTVPSGARVTLRDGDYFGDTPIHRKALPPGGHHVCFHHADAESLKRMVVVKGDQETDLGTLELRLLSRLDLTCLGEGVTALLAGGEVSGVVPLAGGETDLVFRKEGCVPQRLQLRLEPGETRVLEPAPWAPEPGAVDLSGLPEDAEVLLDGARFSGGGVVPVAPGFYSLRFRRRGFGSTPAAILKVGPGETVRVDAPAWVPSEPRVPTGAVPSSVPAPDHLAGDVDRIRRTPLPTSGTGKWRRPLAVAIVLVAGVAFALVHFASEQGPDVEGEGAKPPAAGAGPGSSTARQPPIDGPPSSAAASGMIPGAPPVSPVRASISFTGNVPMTIRLSGSGLSSPRTIRIDDPSVAVTVEDLAPGKYSVAASAPEWEDLAIELDVETGEGKIFRNLTLLPSLGRTITLRPFLWGGEPLSGQVWTLTPPLGSGVAPFVVEPLREGGPTLKDVSTGDWTAGVERKGFRPGLVTFTVRHAEDVLVDPPELEEQKGVLIIDGAEGCTVTVLDGEERIAGPLEVDVEPASFTLRATDLTVQLEAQDAGGTSVSSHEPVSVRPDETSRVLFGPLFGSIDVSIAPKDSAILLDGVQIREEGGIVRRVAPGEHRVAIVAPGRLPYPGVKATVNPGKSTAILAYAEISDPSREDLERQFEMLRIAFGATPSPETQGACKEFLSGGVRIQQGKQKAEFDEEELLGKKFVEEAFGAYELELRRAFSAARDYRSLDYSVMLASIGTVLSRLEEGLRLHLDEEHTALLRWLVDLSLQGVEVHIQRWRHFLEQSQAEPLLVRDPPPVVSMEGVFLPARLSLVDGRIVSDVDGAEMVMVPAGAFLMGEDSSKNRAEKPSHRVQFSTFLVDRHEVTNAQFARFVKETGYVTEGERWGKGVALVGAANNIVPEASWRQPQGPGSSIDGMTLHPVVQVTWNDAQAYCEWAGRRLPTEAEFEFLLRGGRESEMYPWGDVAEVPDGNGNYADESFSGDHPAIPSIPGFRDGSAGTSPVGKYKMTLHGLYDISGNVFEWCADRYSMMTYERAQGGDPVGAAMGALRVAKGGSWRSTLDALRSSFRSSGVAPTVRDSALGFRTAIGFDTKVKDALSGLPPQRLARLSPPGKDVLDRQMKAVLPRGVSRDQTGRIRSTADGAEMVLIPGGEFEMGARTGAAKDGWASAKPPHQVAISPFLVDRTEVTNGQFREFVQATGYRTDAERREGSSRWNPGKNAWEFVIGVNWQTPLGAGSSIQGREEDPVCCVSWNDALLYCQWAGKRLPTEAEFEWMLRDGVSGKLYPWGNKSAPPTRCANLADLALGRAVPTATGHLKSYDDGYSNVAPCGSLDANAFGVFDLSGNLSEWCWDWYDPMYYGTVADGVARDPTGPMFGSRCVLRGGSWSSWNYVFNRHHDVPYGNGDLYGFRCVIGLRVPDILDPTEWKPRTASTKPPPPAPRKEE